MSMLNHFLQQELKYICSQHLANKMNGCVRRLFYGCVHAKDSKVMHKLCNLHASDQVRFFIFTHDFVDGAAIMEKYGNGVRIYGLAAFEWFKALIHTTDNLPGYVVKIGSWMWLLSYSTNGPPVIEFMWG